MLYIIFMDLKDLFCPETFEIIRNLAFILPVLFPALALKRKLMDALAPEFSPVNATAVCKNLRAAGDKLPRDATVPVGQDMRLPVVSYIVSAWTEIQRAGRAGPNEAPTLSHGAPQAIVKLLDCLLTLGVEVALVSPSCGGACVGLPAGLFVSTADPARPANAV
jgi:hypothetical protein